MTQVLTFTGYFLPGFKGGGPIRTIANLLEKLDNEIDFFLVTADRDLGDRHVYSGVQPDKWQQAGNIFIYYASPGLLWIFRLSKIIRNFEGDVLYLNSVFSFRFSILPLLLWRILQSGKPIVLGPRGEFSQAALTLKSFKKRAFIALVKALGIYRDVSWYASSKHEEADIYRIFGNSAKIRIALNISCPPVDLIIQPRLQNIPLRLVFVSRISPMKNLHAAIAMLRQVESSVIFDIYGPVEDKIYWSSCQAAAKKLPPHVQFNYCGPLYPAQVPQALARYDLFFLPTLGENFGHVIAEALGCGLPVLIADTTPWRDLQAKQLGWDIPLDQPDKFVAAIESCCRIPTSDYDLWRQNIRAWALANIGNDKAVEQNRQLFMNLGSKNE